MATLTNRFFGRRLLRSLCSGATFSLSLFSNKRISVVKSWRKQDEYGYSRGCCFVVVVEVETASCQGLLEDDGVE